MHGSHAHIRPAPCCIACRARTTLIGAGTKLLHDPLIRLLGRLDARHQLLQAVAHQKLRHQIRDAPASNARNFPSASAESSGPGTIGAVLAAPASAVAAGVGIFP